VAAVVLAPSAAVAQRRDDGYSPAYRAGYERGVQSAEVDARARRPSDVRRHDDYARADIGYRREYGNPDRYRSEFRIAFEIGYRDGYPSGGWRQGPPPWSNGRGGPVAQPRRDSAWASGFNDGYEAGLRAGHDGRRFDPVREGRYRSADRGYDKLSGPKDQYRLRYRDAFRVGYEQGYEDARRYRARAQRPWWWPF
jgi:hypothetical protein